MEFLCTSFKDIFPPNIIDIKLYTFKMWLWGFDTHVYCKILVNISFTSHYYHVVVMVRIFKIYSYNNSDNTVLLTSITTLYIRSLELIPFLTENLFPLTNMSPFPPSSGPQQLLLYLKIFLNKVKLYVDLTWSIPTVSAGNQDELF